MGFNTGIEWTDSSHNFWYGCKKVSPGCKFCYMFRDMKKYGRNPDDIIRAKGFNKPLTWKQPMKVFVNSWSDFFIEQADDWRADAWQVIRQTPHLVYQILTKRPERIADHLPPDWGNGWPNVWFGVSTENQEYADKRIPELLRIPAVVRFLSCEPLLGPIDLKTHLGLCEVARQGWDRKVVHLSWIPATQSGIHWVIAGGESGPKARPMHPEWIRGLRDQCQAAGVPFFMKQWGEYIPETEIANLTQNGWKVRSEWSPVIRGKEWGCLDISGKYSRETTTWNGRQNDSRDNYEVTIRRVGKKAAGRLLDGVEWNEFPVVERQTA